MPSMIVVLIAVSVALIAVLVAVLAAAERQYDSPRSRSKATTAASRNPAEADGTIARLAPVIAGCITDASRFLPRNSSEARAVDELRSALRLATDGDFQAEVRAVLDALGGIVVLHDVAADAIGGPPVDHLVVASGGVTVVRSVVRTSKVFVDDDEIFLHRGRTQVRDPMIDDVIRQVGAVVAVLDQVTVQGAILFQDVLALPPPIRRGNSSVRGVRLLTLDALESCVLLDRDPEADAIDVAAVVARLRARFTPALPPAGRDTQLGDEDR